MKNGNFWYKWYPEKFDSDVKYLSFEEESLYRKLIDLMYQDKNGCLPNKPTILARICKLQLTEFNRIFASISDYFDLTNDQKIQHTKVGIELHKQNLASEEQSFSGKIGAAIKYLKKELSLSDENCKSLKVNLLEKYDKEFIKGLDKGTLRRTLKGLTSHIYSSGSSSVSDFNSSSKKGAAGEKSEIEIISDLDTSSKFFEGENIEGWRTWFSNPDCAEIKILNHWKNDLGNAIDFSKDRFNVKELVKKIAIQNGTNDEEEILLFFSELVKYASTFHLSGLGKMANDFAGCINQAKARMESDKKFQSTKNRNSKTFSKSELDKIINR